MQHTQTHVKHEKTNTNTEHTQTQNGNCEVESWIKPWVIWSPVMSSPSNLHHQPCARVWRPAQVWEQNAKHANNIQAGERKRARMRPSMLNRIIEPWFVFHYRTDCLCPARHFYVPDLHKSGRTGHHKRCHPEVESGAIIHILSACYMFLLCNANWNQEQSSTWTSDLRVKSALVASVAERYHCYNSKPSPYASFTFAPRKVLTLAPYAFPRALLKLSPGLFVQTGRVDACSRGMLTASSSSCLLSPSTIAVSNHA